MTLIHEDGTGKSDAEAFSSVAESDDYHAKFGDPVAWSGASEPDKEVAKRTAARHIEAEWRGSWIGRRAHAAQALSWPRVEAEDEDGYLIASTVVPQRVKDAESILALKSIEGDTLMPDIDSDAPVTSESVDIGPISLSQDFAGARPVGKQYPLVDEMLLPLTLSGTRIVRA